MADSIFDGIRVLDLTRVIAGPLCTQNLADMGATVYKIERPGEGDDTRRMGPFLPEADGSHSNDSALYMAYNRGKHSLTVDIATPEGAALVRELAMRCDVVVENYKVGALRKYGLDHESLRALRADLIYCSVTGFGQDGPMAARPAYDFILQGMAGMMSTCGQPEGTPGSAPMRTAIPITDVVTGLYATIAVTSALYHRQRTGEGQHIDVAMLDASVAFNGHLAVGYLMNGKVPQRAGNTNPIAAPSEVFACADGHLIVAAGNNTQFQNLCRVLGLAGLDEDARYATNAQRVAHRKGLCAELEAPMRAWHKADLLAALDAVGVPCGPINDMAQVFDAPQTRHREIAFTLPHARGTEVPSLRNPIRYARTPMRYRAAPMLGQDNAAVLTQELGLHPDELADLKKRGVI